MRVCIVTPMYNEEAIAQESVETILLYTKVLPPVVTLLIVNDGSKDRTELIIRDITKGLNDTEFILISHAAKQGYGAAIRTGIKFAIEHCYDYVLFMDSDLTNHPKYIKDFYNKMLEGWDYIKATRYSKGGEAVGVPRKYRLISIVGNAIARNLYRLPLTDITNGFRAVKVSILRQMELKENGFAIIMEELFQAKRLTRSFTELPYTLTSRKERQGKTRFPYTTKTCLRYLHYAIRSRIDS
jgi:glycosyltransferase involved in cell wall biosynthesis